MKTDRNFKLSNASQDCRRRYTVLFNASEAVATMRAAVAGSEPAMLAVAFPNHCETVGSDLPEAEAVAKLLRLMNTRGAPLGIIRGVVKDGTREVEMGVFEGLPDMDVPIAIMQNICATILEDYRSTGTFPQMIPLRLDDPRESSTWGKPGKSLVAANDVSSM